MQIDEILKRIDMLALLALCREYDEQVGQWPEHEYEGQAVFSFFDNLKDTVEDARRNKMKEKLKWKKVE